MDSIASLPPPVVEGFVRVCHADEIAPGLGRSFRVGERLVAVFRPVADAAAGPEVWAVDNRCPHKQGPLADGMLVGGSVVCPMHAFRYNLRDGQCDQPHACPVTCHETRLIEGFVYVRVAS